MKYLWLGCAFSLCCSVVHAEEDCATLKVHIKNNSGNDCVLKKHYIELGKLVDKSQIPEVIFRDKEAFFSLTWDFQSPYGNYFVSAMLMTFQCGDDKEVTLFSNTPNISKSSVLEQTNMTASGSYIVCSSSKNLPWQLNWVLKPDEAEEVVGVPLLPIRMQ